MSDNFAFWSLIKTIAIELPVFLLLIRVKLTWEIPVFCILMNCFTQPLALFAYRQWGNFFGVEISVVIVESLLIYFYWQKKWWLSILIALITNVCSAYFYLIEDFFYNFF